MITKDQLKNYYIYDPLTGLFISRISRQGCAINSVCKTKNTQGYIHILIKGTRYLAHRLAFLYMIGRFPVNDVDHINMKRDDNRWDNLREATRSQNCSNKKAQSNNKSGYKGVSYNKKSGRYYAQITIGDKRKHLGTFTNPESAYIAYCEAARKVHNEFVNLGVCEGSKED